MVLQVVPILSQPVLADSWTETSVADFTGGTLQEVVATAPGDLQLRPNGTGFAKRGIVLGNGPPGSPDSVWARNPSVLWESDGSYKMWYCGSDGSQSSILLATSLDGVAWSKQGVVLQTFTTVCAPFVLREGSTYHMWFEGGLAGGGAIYHAQSPDGLAWTVNGTALQPGAGWDGTIVAIPWVVHTNGEYRMYYTGSDGSADRVGLATSSSYTGFSRVTGLPILDLGQSGAWDGEKVRCSAVVNGTGGVWLMTYGGLRAGYWRVGTASSQDGLSWTKTGNPVLSPDPAPSWDYRAVVGAAIIDTPQGRRAYYTGSDDSRIQIGLGVEAPGFSPTGSYLSRVFDSGVRNTWNRVSVNGTLPPNSDVVAFLRTGETVQPDATWSGWQTVDPSSGAVGPLRGRYAQYLLSLSTFEAVDTPVVHDVSVIYQLNFGPTGIPRDPANESWVAVDTPVLKWSSSDSEGDRQVSFQIDLSREASFGTIAHSSGTVSSTTTEWQALSLEEGLWYWRVRLSDGMTWGPWTNSSFRVDLTAPSLSLATPKERDALNSGIVRVSWSVEDSLSGVDRIELKLDDGPIVTVNPSNANYTFSGLADGEHFVDVVAFDRVQHPTSVKVSFVVDRMPPALEIIGPAQDLVISSNRVDLLWKADGTGSNLSRFEIQMDDAEPVVQPGTQRSFTFTGVQDGVHIITLRAFDRAGNYETAVVRVRVDTGFFSPSGPYGPWPVTTVIIVAIMGALLGAVRIARSRGAMPPPPT